MSSSGPWLVLSPDPEDLPARLDSWLAGRIEGLSRRKAAEMIAGGLVTLNGAVARKGATLAVGDEIAVLAAPRPRRWSAAPAPGVRLEVALEDPAFVAVVKPAGVASVPLRPDEPDTLAGAVAARFPECAPLGRSPGDSGLLQRLDGDTSGLLLAARNRRAFDRLLALQSAGRFEKVYLALVRGRPSDLPRSVEAPLAPAGGGGRLVRPDAKGVPASTRLEPLRQVGEWLLLEATIAEGFRHQIRAHLASVGMPIAGDGPYRGPALPGLERLFLHSARLSFPHPEGGRRVSVSAALPPELARLA